MGLVHKNSTLFGEKTHIDGDVWLLKLHVVQGLFSVSCDILSR